MNIDVTQFHQVFFEESLEGLDIMESILLQMESGKSEDDEDINAVFRVAHSIKGGAGTFGFAEISEFTHVQETLLDEIRSGNRHMTAQIVSLLLSAVDTLREMIAICQTKDEIPTGMGQEIVDSLKNILEDEQDEGKSVQASSDALGEPSGAGINTWVIKFTPHKDMLRTGNDPVRMISALAEMGDIDIVADAKNVPVLTDIDPESSYLSWVITLISPCTESDITEIFEWVEDECGLEIKKVEVIAAAKENADQDTTAPVMQEAQVVENAIIPVDRRAQRERRESDDRRNVDPGRRQSDGGVASSIRVGTDKIDELINMVGELVITQSMLGVLGEDFNMSKVERLQDGLTELERHTRQLQESIMRIRMVPINFVFSRFPRMVHDLSIKLDKKIDLRISGENTELDKTVVEQIGDPLTHLVRNSVDHGIETSEERLKLGKPEKGEVHLNAYHKGGSIVIEISDDGAGLNTAKILQKAIEKGLVGPDEELSESRIHELIFNPGFSTVDEVSDLSGRGVGMDVVRKNIIRLGGNIEIKSKEGQGSIFRISLPLTLAILDGQIISVGSEKYVVPIASIIESIQVKPDMVNKVSGKGEVFELRGEYVPILRMHELFGVEGDYIKDLENGILVVVEGDGKKCGLFVDLLLGQQQIVIKSLETNFVRIQGLSGATIFGDGSVALILDIPGVVRQAIENQRENS